MFPHSIGRVISVFVWFGKPLSSMYVVKSANDEVFNPHKGEIAVMSKPRRPKGFFQFEIIINVSWLFPLLLNSYTMLWVYGYHIFFISYIAGIVLRRQNLTSMDVTF